MDPWTPDIVYNYLLTLNCFIMTILDRAKAPTPTFFKVLRTIGLVIAAVGGTILTAPISLPTAVVTVGGYLAVAGGVMSAVSQVAKDDSPKEESDESS